MEKQVYSVQEAAEILGISKNTCYTLCRESRLPHVRIGKRRIVIPIGALQGFLASQLGSRAS